MPTSTTPRRAGVANMPVTEDAHDAHAELLLAGLQLAANCSNKASTTKQQSLEIEMQTLQDELKLQHLYQDASHIMVQKSAQMEIDLDQTAALLCQQMQEAADRDAAMCQLQAQLAWERDQRIMAMAAIFPLNAQLQLKNHELGRAADMNIRLKAIVDQANKVLAQNLLATPADDQEPIIRMKSARPDHIARSRACKVAAATKLIRAGSTPNCS